MLFSREGIALLISIIALLISAGSFYFDKIRLIDDIRVLQVERNIDARLSSDGTQLELKKLDVSVIYMNLGNQESAILDASLSVALSRETQCHDITLANSFVLHFDMKMDPVVLKPSELRFQSLSKNIAETYRIPTEFSDLFAYSVVACLSHRIVASDSSLLSSESLVQTGSVIDKSIEWGDPPVPGRVQVGPGPTPLVRRQRTIFSDAPKKANP
jgi:hypothetical protein